MFINIFITYQLVYTNGNHVVVQVICASCARFCDAKWCLTSIEKMCVAVNWFRFLSCEKKKTVEWARDRDSLSLSLVEMAEKILELHFVFASP